MKSFVFTLGFHEDFIERRLHLNGASPGDPIAVFTCEPVASGTLRAYEGLKARAVSLGLTKPRLVELKCHEPAEAIYVARRMIRPLPEPVICDLSGGMRIAVLIVYTSLIFEKKHFTLYIQPESGIQEVEIPYEILELIWKPLPPEEEKLLKTITYNPGASAKELALILGKKEKTITNQLAHLKKHNLIVKKGRKPSIYPTKWANAITVPTQTNPGTPSP